MKIVTAFVLSLLSLSSMAATADMSSGRRDYEHNCAMCHGTTGKGNGWLTQYLSVKVPSLTELKKNSGGVFPAKQVQEAIDGTKDIQIHGSRTMPVWGHAFRLSEAGAKGAQGKSRAKDDAVRARIRALVDYIAKLQE